MQIGLHSGPCEDHAGTQLYFVAQRFAGYPFVTLECQAVDNRIFDNPDDNVLTVLADIHVRKQPGREKRLQRLVEYGGGNGVTRPHPHIGPDGIGLDTLCAFDAHVAQPIFQALRPCAGRHGRQCHQNGEEAHNQLTQNTHLALPRSCVLHVTRLTKKSTTRRCTRSFQVANTIKANTMATPILNPYSCARSPRGRPRRASMP